MLGGAVPGGGGGWRGAPPRGQPLAVRASWIMASTLTRSPMSVTVPMGSEGWWSIFTSAPLLARIS